LKNCTITIKIKTIKTLEPDLLIGSQHGIYIPQLFCENYLQYVTNVSELQPYINDCLKGADSETYLDSWVAIESNAKL
jgi:hypothetical protein